MFRHLKVLFFLLLCPKVGLYGQSSLDSLFFQPHPASDSAKLTIVSSKFFSPFFFSASSSFLHSGNPSVPSRISTLPDAVSMDFYSLPLWNPSFLNTIPRGLFSFRHPITITQALVSSQKEQNFYIFHSRNISPKWNFCSEMEFFRTPGIIANSSFNSSRIDFFGSGVTGNKNHILTRFDFSHSKNFGPQSGGISDSLDILKGTGPAGNSNALLDVNFSNAFSRHIFTRASIEAWWKMGGAVIIDSLKPLRNFYSGSFLFTSFHGSDGYHFFSQRTPSEDAALIPALDSTGYNERSFLRNGTVRAGWLKRHSSSDRQVVFCAALSNQYYFLSQNFQFNNFNFLSISLNSDLDYKKYGFQGSSNYFFNGIRAGNYQVILRPWIKLKNTDFRLFAQLKSGRNLPDYRFFFFNGNQYYWNNPLLNTNTFYASSGIQNPRLFSIEFGGGALTHLARLNLDSDKVEFSGRINFIFTRWQIEREIGRYFLKMDAVIQGVSDQGFQTGIPRTNIRFSNHYSFSLLKEKLKLTPGVDLDLFEGLKPYSYHAPTGLFAFRSASTLQSGLIAGFFVGFRLQTFRATLRIDNMLDRVLSPNPVIMLDGFPVQSRVIRFNLVWVFWD